jgi:hypothetical protein
MSTDPLASAFDRIRKAVAALKLPEVTESMHYGTPALAVRGKSFVRMKDKDTLVVMCPLEDKEMLMEAAPEIYYETDHYKGWPAVLVRLKVIKVAELKHRLVQAWRAKAPKRLVQSFDERHKAPMSMKKSR